MQTAREFLEDLAVTEEHLFAYQETNFNASLPSNRTRVACCGLPLRLYLLQK
jgi:hypothetical protein